VRSYRKYSLSEKLNILRMVDKSNSVESIARDLEINRNVIKQWKRLYDAEGIKGLEKKSKNNKYSNEFKLSVIREHIDNGLSFPKLVAKYNLRSSGMVANWFRDYTIGKKFYPNRNQRNQVVKDGRKTTKIERIEIAQWAIANDHAYNEAADKFKVSYQQVYTWVRKLEKAGPDSLSDRRGKSKKAPLTELELAKLEIKRLKSENKHLELDNVLSKKLMEIQRRGK